MADEDWARNLSAADLELWSLPDYEPAYKDIRKRAAAIAEKQRREAERQRRASGRMFWTAVAAAIAAWGSATAAIVRFFDR